MIILHSLIICLLLFPGGYAPNDTGARDPIVGIAPFVGAYEGYKGDVGDWSQSLYPIQRDKATIENIYQH